MRRPTATWSDLARRALQAWAAAFGVDADSIARIDAALAAPGRAARRAKGEAQCPDLFVAGLRSQPVSDASSLLPSAARTVHVLEAAAGAITEEYRSLRERGLPGPEPEAANLTTGGTWTRLDVLGGRARTGDAGLVPRTWAALTADPEIVAFDAAHVSIVAEGTRIRPHYGPHNARLRLHLGLAVPERCGLRVGDVVTGWEAGRVVVFDDSFEHEVWNDGPDDRAVLIVDVWHPDLTAAERSALAFVTRELPVLAPELVLRPGAPTFLGGPGR